MLLFDFIHPIKPQSLSDLLAAEVAFVNFFFVGIMIFMSIFFVVFQIKIRIIKRIKQFEYVQNASNETNKFHTYNVNWFDYIFIFGSRGDLTTTTKYTWKKRLKEWPIPTAPLSSYTTSVKSYSGIDTNIQMKH